MPNTTEKVYLVGYDVKAQDSEAYNRVFAALNKALDNLRAESILESQCVIRGFETAGAIRNRLLSSVSGQDQRFVRLLVIPLPSEADGTIAVHGVKRNKLFGHR